MPVDIAFNGAANINIKLMNTGNVEHEFFVGLATRPPGGELFEAEAIPIRIAPGVEVTVTHILNELNVPGLWPLMVNVWSERPFPGITPDKKLHETGWIEGAINVLAAEAPPPPEAITAQIIEVLINNARVF